MTEFTLDIPMGYYREGDEAYIVKVDDKSTELKEAYTLTVVHNFHGPSKPGESWDVWYAKGIAGAQAYVGWSLEKFTVSQKMSVSIQGAKQL